MNLRRWRGLQSLAHDAVDATTELVDVGHSSASRRLLAATDRVPGVRDVARCVEGIRCRVTRGVLATVRGVNQGVRTASGWAWTWAEEASDDESRAPWSSGPVGDRTIGWLNGAVGHRLDGEDDLDHGMQLRLAERPLALDDEDLAEALPAGARRLAIFVHGLGMTEDSWVPKSNDPGTEDVPFGLRLQRDLGVVPLYVRYNSGRRIAENGRRLAALLDRLDRIAPCSLEDWSLVGHSMGGLVVRSACHFGHESAASWSRKTRLIVCLGSPHRGAPLAKLGRIAERGLGAVDLPATRILSRIVGGRSLGIRDLRDGRLLDEGRVPSSPVGARLVFVSATLTSKTDHPLGRWVGDLLVPESSAAGPERGCPPNGVEVLRFGGIGHQRLTTHPDVYRALRRLHSDDR